MSLQSVIPVVALGVYRHVAATTVDLFVGSPYTMAAIVDCTSEPAAFQYTPHNLGVVFHTLIPRPEVFVTGARISEEMTNESIKVWEEYVRVHGVKDALVVNLLSEPPENGDWRGAIMGRLDKKYGGEKEVV